MAQEAPGVSQLKDAAEREAFLLTGHEEGMQARGSQPMGPEAFWITADPQCQRCASFGIFKASPALFDTHNLDLSIFSSWGSWAQ